MDGATDADETASLAVQLLVDIRQIFADKRVAFLSTADLLAELRRIEESPWDDFELNSRKLAQRLRQFGIKPGRAERNTVRGYELEAFTDAFLRYTRPHPSKPSATDVDQPQHADGSKGADTSIRPQQNMCPQQTAGQTELGTGWTGEEHPRRKRVNRRGIRPPPATGRCTDCGTELFPATTPVCALSAHMLRVSVFWPNGSGRWGA